MTCDSANGSCQCKANVIGQICNQCNSNTYGLDAGDEDGCSPCDCDLTGTVSFGSACNQNTGQCPCLAFRMGRRCDACSPGQSVGENFMLCVEWDI